MMNSGSFAEGYAVGRDANGNSNGYGNGMWGTDGWWAIILFAMIFGWGNNGWGGGFGGRGNDGANTFLPYAVGQNGALTRGELCQDMNFQSLENGVRGIQQGLCDGFYAVNTSLLNGFNGVDNAICSAQYATQQGFNATQMALMQAQNAIQTQASDCCCKTQTAIAGVENAITGLGCTLGREIERGFCDSNYNLASQANAIQVQMANNTRDIIDSQQSGTRAILDYLCQEKISTLQAENQALRLTASQQAQNVAIGAMINASEANIIRRTGNDCPIPAYVVPNPNCCYNGYGLNGYGYNGYNNSGCGCNSGCCGCNG